MTDFDPDTFKQADRSGWGTSSDGEEWTRIDLSSPSPSWTWVGTWDEMCPICALIIDDDLDPEDRQKGIELWEKYMMVDVQSVSDGKGHVSSWTGWACSMCGASGEGTLPHFHAKPKKE